VRGFLVSNGGMMYEKRIMIDEKIAGILTYPSCELKSTSQLPAVLMLHGFGTDKNEVANFYGDIAKQLADNNVISLRIDFRGYGESSGKAECLSIDDMLDDAIKAFNHLVTLQSDPKKLGVIGFSLGAAIALLLTQKVSFQQLALLSPAVNLYDDFSGFLGQKTMEKLANCEKSIKVDLVWREINIGKDFYMSLKQCDPLSIAAKFNGNLLCIAGEKDFSAGNVKLICEKLSLANSTKEIIADADHVFNITGLPNLATKTAQWLSFFLQSKSTDSDTTKGHKCSL